MTAVCVSGLPSASEPLNTMLTEVSSLVVTPWLLATGRSLTAVMVIETVATAESTAPSFTLNVKLSEPLAFAFGL